MEGIRAGPEQDSTDGINEKHAPQQQGAGPPPPLTLSPMKGTEALVESAINRHAQRVDVLFLKAVWGGIFLSYGGFFEAVVAGSAFESANNAGILRLIEALVFPVGLFMIITTGSELLTSDMMIIALGAIKGRVPWWGVAWNYVIVFLGNLAGSLFFAAILVRYADLSTAAITNFIVMTAQTRAVTTAWHAQFLRGIGCNIMVNMAVYQATIASDLVSKAFGVWIALSTFVALQYSHVVADMFLIPMGMMLGADVSVGRYIGHAMVPVALGNLVGAALLGLSLYWFYLHDTHRPFFGKRARDYDSDKLFLNGRADQRGPGGPFGDGSAGTAHKIQHSLGIHRGFHVNDGKY